MGGRRSWESGFGVRGLSGVGGSGIAHSPSRPLQEGGGQRVGCGDTEHRAPSPHPIHTSQIHSCIQRRPRIDMHTAGGKLAHTCAPAGLRHCPE